MLPVLNALPTQDRQTLTWDQGSEIASHHLFEHYFADGIFFAPPASPWLRGTNKNTNGLLRQYFPKGTDLRAYTLADLQAVEERLNSRPRERLAWRSPARVMEAELAGSTGQRCDDQANPPVRGCGRGTQQRPTAWVP
jgi:transposase, IS30 family